MSVVAVRSWRCRLCPNGADGDLDVIGALCVDCADRVLERMFALLEVEPVDRRAVLERLPNLAEPDPTAPEPLPRKHRLRTRAERHRAWIAAGLVERGNGCPCPACR